MYDKSKPNYNIPNYTFFQLKEMPIKELEKLLGTIKEEMSKGDSVQKQILNTYSKLVKSAMEKVKEKQK